MRFAIAAALAAVSVTALVAPPAGSTGNAPPANCSQVTHPGSGLQRFVARLRPGDTGCLQPGYYDIRRLILGNRGTPKAPIVLRSVDPNHPATLHGVVWLKGSGAYWTIEDLRIDGRNPWNLPSPIVNGSHSIWRRLDVSNRGSGDGTQPYAGGICFNVGSTDSYGYAGDTTIEQSRIHDCGVSTNHNHGIYASATTGTTIIRDNWIYRNGDRGVQLYPAANHVLVTRNVIDSNGSGVIFSGTGSLTSSNDVVTGNIISNSRNRWNVESFYPAWHPAGQRQYRDPELFLGELVEPGISRPRRGLRSVRVQRRRRECRPTAALCRRGRTGTSSSAQVVAARASGHSTIRRSGPREPGHARAREARLAVRSPASREAVRARPGRTRGPARA